MFIYQMRCEPLHRILLSNYKFKFYILCRLISGLYKEHTSALAILQMPDEHNRVSI